MREDLYQMLVVNFKFLHGNYSFLSNHNYHNDSAPDWFTKHHEGKRLVISWCAKY